MDDDTLAKLIILTLAGLLFSALGLGAYFVVRDTRRGLGKWGVNTKPMRCPECGEPAPIARVPKNRRQTLWGGATCARCGCEYDKWGHRVEEG